MKPDQRQRLEAWLTQMRTFTSLPEVVADAEALAACLAALAAAEQAVDRHEDEARAKLAEYRAEIERQAQRADAAEQALEACRASLQAVEQERDEASAALDELVAPDSSKTLAQRIKDEFQDFQMVVRHCSEIYDHVTRGQVSKPNTLPSVVKVMADDCLTELVEEETADLRQQLEQAEAKLAVRGDVPVPVDCTCPPFDPSCPHHGVNRYTAEQEASFATAQPDPRAEAVRVLTALVQMYGPSTDYDGNARALWAQAEAALRAEGEGGG